jgi:hypothetical protein
MSRNQEFEDALAELGRTLEAAGHQPMTNPVKYDPAEHYGGHIFEHHTGLRYHPYGGGPSQPVEKLYRVVHPDEWKAAKEQGYLQATSGGGGYTRASVAPDERWRHQGRAGDTLEARAPRGHTLEIDYHPEDRWQASAEGYAATKAKIPLHRVRRVE